MKKTVLTLAAATLLAAGCTHKTTASGDLGPGVAVGNGLLPVSEGGENYVPKATAFKLSGPYADKVAVTLSPSGELSYYPAPSDITSASAPTYLGDGWWLNNQGISANSVFTSWTFTEYASLKTTPSIAEIKAHIIPESGITEFRRLSMPIYNASSSLPQIRRELGIK